MSPPIQNPQMSGGWGQMAPMPPTGMGPIPQMSNDTGFAPQAGGSGVSMQPPVSQMAPKPPQPVQPPNPGGQQAGAGVQTQQSANTMASQGPQAQPTATRSGAQQQTAYTGAVPPPKRPGMVVHNPTGVGATQASQMAAAQSTIPANQPTKRQGAVPPTPQTIPGAPK